MQEYNAQYTIIEQNNIIKNVECLEYNAEKTLQGIQCREYTANNTMYILQCI